MMVPFSEAPNLSHVLQSSAMPNHATTSAEALTRARICVNKPLWEAACSYTLRSRVLQLHAHSLQSFSQLFVQHTASAIRTVNQFLEGKYPKKMCVAKVTTGQCCSAVCWRAWFGLACTCLGARCQSLECWQACTNFCRRPAKIFQVASNCSWFCGSWSFPGHWLVTNPVSFDVKALARHSPSHQTGRSETVPKHSRFLRFSALPSRSQRGESKGHSTKRSMDADANLQRPWSLCQTQPLHTKSANWLSRSDSCKPDCLRSLPRGP